MCINDELSPSSHTLPLTTVKRARLKRSSIHNIPLAWDIGDGCRPVVDGCQYFMNILKVFSTIKQASQLSNFEYTDCFNYDQPITVCLHFEAPRGLCPRVGIWSTLTNMSDEWQVFWHSKLFEGLFIEPLLSLDHLHENYHLLRTEKQTTKPVH